MSQIFDYNKQRKIALLGLKVKANAKINLINHLIMVNNKLYLKLSIKAIPENGKANNAIIDFLAKKWQITKHDLEIISGHTNNFKIIAIKNIVLDYLNLCLSYYIK